MFQEIMPAILVLSRHSLASFGFAAIHMLLRAISIYASSTIVMVRFRQYVAQTNATFTGCKLLLSAENLGGLRAFPRTKIALLMQCLGDWGLK